MASCPCCGSELLGGVHPLGLPLSPPGRLWSAVFRCRLPGRLDGLPAGITVEGATPDGEGRWCDHSGAPPPPARWRTSAEKQGVAPSTNSPYRAARRVRRRTRRPRPTALFRRGLGESVPTHVQCGFPGKAHTTAARAAPSDSAVLWLSKECTTCVHHSTL